MRTYLILALGLICLSVMLMTACAPASEPAPEVAPEPPFDQAAEEAAVREAAAQMNAALNKHDAEAIGMAAAALVTEDYENWVGTVKGRAAHEKNLAGMFAGQHIHVKQLEEIGIIFVTPNVAIYKDRSESTGTVDEDGNPLPPARYLQARVYVKRSGEWLQSASFSRPIED